MNAPTPFSRPRTSLFEEVIHYTMRMSKQDIQQLPTQPSNLGLAILSIAGAEWLTIIKYITTRLIQIEYELEDPLFRTPYGLDDCLKRLHP